MYIKRAVEKTLVDISKSFPCIVVYGPRQVGKSTTVNRIFGDKFKTVTLDDITLFDLDTDPLVVSYYQMKTSEGLITIDSAISEDWLVKLYAQFNRPEGWLVKELGLITNTPLEVSYKAIILLFALIIALLYYNPAPILIRSNPLYQTLFL